MISQFWNRKVLKYGMTNYPKYKSYQSNNNSHMNFVLYQILWTMALLFFCVISYFVACVFTRFKRARVLCEILLCLIIFSFFLAFRVNF